MTKKSDATKEAAFDAGEGKEAPQTLDDYIPKPRTYTDRMLRPQRGMDSRPWAGKPHWVCPRCRKSTFDEAAAKAHRC